MYDAIVIGSGFGGGAAAYKLKKAGWRVLIVERGQARSGRREESSGDQILWQDDSPEGRNGVINLQKFSSVSVLSGSGVGGGSLAYANAFSVPTRDIFKEGWLPEITFGELHPYFESAGRIMGVQNIPYDQEWNRTQVIRQVAKSHGWQFSDMDLTIRFDENRTSEIFGYSYSDEEKALSLPDPGPYGAVSRLTGVCAHRGDCSIGCPFNAKNTVENSYLNSFAYPDSPYETDPEILTSHIVRDIKSNGSRYDVTFENLEDSTDPFDTVSARIVILAAGSLASTELLLRCQQRGSLRNLSGQLGRKWNTNGFFFFPCFVNTEKIYANAGPHTTCSLNFMDRSQGGAAFTIEDGGFPRILTRPLLKWLAASTPTDKWTEKAYQMTSDLSPTGEELINNVLPLIVQGMDSGYGELSLRKGKLNLKYSLRDSHKMLEAITPVVRRICESIDGRFLIPFAASPPNQIVTPHPLGGCPMGSSAESGVVDHGGQVFGNPGLYVLDGSIIPQALGCPPSRTIAALSERATDLLIKAEGYRSGASYSCPRVYTSSSVSSLELSGANLDTEIESDEESILVASAPHSIKVSGGEGGPTSPQSAPAQGGPDAPTQRFIEGRFPSSVQLGKKLYLEIRIGTEAAGGTKTTPINPGVLPEDLATKVLLLLYAPDFTIADDRRDRTINVPAKGNSDFAIWELTPNAVGTLSLSVTAYCGSAALGELNIQVGSFDGVAVSASTTKSSAVQFHESDPGEITLEIRYDPKNSVYNCSFISTNMHTPDMELKPLRRPQELVFTSLISQLNDMARGVTKIDPAQMRDYLRGKGLELWLEFIPEELQTLFWKERANIKRMTIRSGGDPIPWELLYPTEPGKSPDPSVGFLGESFDLTRWRFGKTPTTSIRNGRICFVLPPSAPKKAFAEIDNLKNIVGGDSIVVGNLKELRGVLQSADFGILHFACHNSFDQTTARIKMPDGPLEPSTLLNYLNKFDNPFIFMNACRTDGQTQSYTRLGGWADSFLDTGVGAFIGSLWEIRDDSASRFAATLYGNLKTRSLGEAVTAARKSIDSGDGDPTWLAYSVYGSAEAKITS